LNARQLRVVKSLAAEMSTRRNWHQLEAAEAAAEVGDPPVGERRAAVGRADGDERLDPSAMPRWAIM
jgi:hypothetical protein